MCGFGFPAAVAANLRASAPVEEQPKIQSSGSTAKALGVYALVIGSLALGIAVGHFTGSVGFGVLAGAAPIVGVASAYGGYWALQQRDSSRAKEAPSVEESSFKDTSEGKNPLATLFSTIGDRDGQTLTSRWSESLNSWGENAKLAYRTTDGRLENTFTPTPTTPLPNRASTT